MKRTTGLADTSTGFTELVEDMRPLRAAEIEAVRDADGAGPSAGHVAGGLGNGRLASLEGIQQHVAGVTVGCECDTEVGVRNADQRGVAARTNDGRGLHRRIILFEDPPLAA